MALRAKWQGREPADPAAEFVPGVPARDLSDEEFDALSDEQKLAVAETKGSDGKHLYSLRGETREEVREAAEQVKKDDEASPEARGVAERMAAEDKPRGKKGGD